MCVGVFACVCWPAGVCFSVCVRARVCVCECVCVCVQTKGIRVTFQCPFGLIALKRVPL